MTGGGAGRAGVTNGGLPGAGPGARGKLSRPDNPTSPETRQEARRPARRGSGAPGQGFDGMTGLRAPRRTGLYGRSPRTCFGVSAD
jgi:hypothetical protein